MDYDKIIRYMGDVRPSSRWVGGLDIDVLLHLDPLCVTGGCVTLRPKSGGGWKRIKAWMSYDMLLVVVRATREDSHSIGHIQNLEEEIERRAIKIAEEFEISEFAVAEVRAYRKEKAGKVLEYGIRIHDRIEREYREGPYATHHQVEAAISSVIGEGEACACADDDDESVTVYRFPLSETGKGNVRLDELNAKLPSGWVAELTGDIDPYSDGTVVYDVCVRPVR